MRTAADDDKLRLVELSRSLTVVVPKVARTTKMTAGVGEELRTGPPSETLPIVEAEEVRTVRNTAARADGSYTGRRC